MNIFFRELKAHRKSLVVWAVSITAFMFMSMAKYSALATDASASQELMKAFPPTIQAVFGMTGLDMTTMTGYYGICFIFIAVMLAIHAGMLGAEIVAKEESDKTAEFLYVKPISRARALTAKLLAGLVLLAIIFTVTHIATAGSIASVNHGIVPTKELAVFEQALAVIQVLFFSIGVFFAAAFKFPKKAAAVTAGIVFLCYIANVVYCLSPNFEWFKNLSPFAYFNAPAIIAQGTLDSGYVLLCAIVCVAAIGYAYLGYTSRDIAT